MNKEEKLQELFQTPRMGMHSLNDFNSVRGLHVLVENCFKPDFEMVEVGSFQGVSTQLFALFTKTVYSVDCYDYKVPPTGRIPEHDQLFVDAEKLFLERTSHIDNIIKIKKTSIDASKDFENNSLDAVYIDAEHDYDSILSDVQTWKNKIKNGGVLCGHDWDHNHATDIQNILEQENLLNDLTVYPDSSWSVIIK